MDGNSISPAIPLVNLNSLQNLLDDSRQTVKNTGTLPKLASNLLLLPYGQWQRDTALRRTTADLEQRHQSEIDTRRRRELDLVEEIQKDTDTERFRKHESDTKKRLQEFSDRQAATELRRYEELQQRDAEIRQLKDAERRLTGQFHLYSQAHQSEHVVGMVGATPQLGQQRPTQPGHSNSAAAPLEDFAAATGFVFDPNPISAIPIIPSKINSSLRDHGTR